MLKLQGKQFMHLILFPSYRLVDTTWLTLFCSAYGEFVVTKDCSDITSASFLKEVGKKMKCMVRISTVGPERGSADTIRDDMAGP